MNRVIAALACVAAAGCTVPDLDDIESTRTRNECSDDADCGSGNSCVSGSCRAPQSDFDTVLVTVTPPGTEATPAAGVRFLTTVADLASANDHLELGLSLPSTVTGSVVAPKAENATCTYLDMADDRSIPADLTFTPTERPLGLSAKSYKVSTALEPRAGGDGHTYSVALPAGDYDIYIQPKEPPLGPGSEGACMVAPAVLPNVEIPTVDSTKAVSIDIPVAKPAALSVTIRWPSTSPNASSAAPPPSLEGWVPQMLEPRTGQVVSATLKALEEPTFSQEHVDEVEYTFTLHYTQQAGSMMGQELLRLTPPEGVTAPTMVWNREALELFPGSTTIDLLTFPAQTVTVEGQVETAAGEPLPAALTVSSIEVESLGAGLLSSFSAPAVAGPDGKFVVELLPGKYRVVAEPDAETGLPAAVDEWQVASEPSFQAGKLVTLQNPGAMTGRVVAAVPGAPPVSGANVSAFASPSKSSQTAFKTQVVLAPHVPRASNGVTASDGAFDVQADPGTFDLSIRPATETGFPWLVRPRVTVPNKGLGRLEMPLPVVHRGTVFFTDDEGQPVMIGGARIGVYVFVGPANEGYVKAPSEADSVLKVAESLADADGSFSILLPESLR